MSPKAARHIILAGDLVWVAFSALAAFMLRTAAPWDAPHLEIALRASWFLITVSAIAWVFIFHRLKLDGFYGGYELPAMFSQLFTGIVTLVVLLASAGFLLHRDSSRLLLFNFAALFLVLAFAGRLTARTLARRFAGRGRLHRIVILGKGKVAQELAARIHKHPEMRWELVGFLFPSADDVVEPILQSGQASRISSLGIESLLQKQAVDEVVLTAPVPDQGEMLNLVANCRHRGVRVSVVPNLYQLYINRPALLDLDGLPLLRLAEGRPALFQRALKRGVDLAVSLVLLLVATPLMVCSAVVLRVLKGKAMASELRCGRGGRVFWMYRLNCARNGDASSSLERWLRMLSVSELPQLWNVAKGDMSLVGPRPESEERVKRYSDWQRQRLVCKPGMTGLAQVHGLREESSSEDKAYYDLRYIQDWSLLTDLSLIVQTVWTIMRRLFRSPAKAHPVQADAKVAANPNEFIELVHADRP
jgi:lipopolysaccharide/colanic/teichoic acid biosynthesis glycosyltransferase